MPYFYNNNDLYDCYRQSYKSLITVCHKCAVSPGGFLTITPIKAILVVFPIPQEVYVAIHPPLYHCPSPLPHVAEHVQVLEHADGTDAHRSVKLATIVVGYGAI